jgi:SPX domain protein involved in polyphosphate accumulation
VQVLEAELDKVFTFQKVKSGEIVRRIKVSQKEVEDVIKLLDSREEVQRPTENDFEMLEEDLSDIIADVHDLAKFTQLNYSGFQKIIKKHDVSVFLFVCFWTEYRIGQRADNACG